ncbi:MAG: ABC transporter substrate-binding protein, partial [Chitinophagales bacterium]
MLLLIMIFDSCSDAREGHPLKIFRYNQAAGITSLDPAFSSTQSNIWGVNMLFNGLLQVDSTLRILPCIAKTWEISDDGKIYTFHLRRDVFFHDDTVFENGKGRRVVAEDFVYSFNRIIDPKVASKGAWIFSDKVEKQLPFSAPDDSTFIIRLAKAFPALPGILTMQYCSVVPKEAVMKFGKYFRIHPVGTGPFQLKVWKEGVVLLVFKNPHYFEKDAAGNSLPYIDGVRITFIDSKATEFLKFRQHEYDFMNDVDPSFKDDVLTKDGELQAKYSKVMNLQKSVNLNTEYIGFNLADTSKNNPLLKKEVRQAINYGIDKDKMMLYLRNSIGVPAWHGFVPMGLAGYDVSKVRGYNYDPQKARTLIYNAGYFGNKGMPVVKLLCNSTGEVLCNFIVNELKQVGVNATLETMQGKALNDQMVKGNARFFRGGWIGDYPDAENFLTLFYSGYGAPPNYTRFKNEEFDEAYEASFTITDDAVRNELYREMDELVMEE